MKSFKIVLASLFIGLVFVGCGVESQDLVNSKAQKVLGRLENGTFETSSGSDGLTPSEAACVKTCADAYTDCDNACTKTCPPYKLGNPTSNQIGAQCVQKCLDTLATCVDACVPPANE